MKTDHLTPEDGTGYIYRTLDDGQRELIDAHLLHCPVCRASLSQHEIRQRQISNELTAVLNAASPSRNMNFSTIAPRLQRRAAGLQLGPRLAAYAPAAFSLAGLVLALVGLFQTIGSRTLEGPPQRMDASPILAGFVFLLTSVHQFDHTVSIRPRLVMTWFVAGTLWLGSAIIGLLDLIVIRDLAIMAVTFLDGRNAQAGPVAIMAVMAGVMLYIALVIGGADYHLRNIGQPGSWKLFTITLLGQVFLLVLPYLII